MKIGVVFMKKSVLSALMLFALFSVPVFGASTGLIDCQRRPSVNAVERPGSTRVIGQFQCNQSVSIIGMEQGYVEIQIDENLKGFIPAQYIRMFDQSATPVIPAAPLAPVTPKAPAVPDTEANQNDISKPEYPRFEIFTGYSFSHWGKKHEERNSGFRHNTHERLNMNGWNASFTSNINSVFGIKGEVSGIYGKLRSEEKYISADDEDFNFSSNNDLQSIQGYSFMVGPQATRRLEDLNLPFDVFGHLLVGVEHHRVKNFEDNGPVFFTSNAFAMALGGGLDWKIDNWIIRAPQIDYFPWSFGGESAYYDGGLVQKGSTIKNLRLSFGIVFRFE